MSSDKIAIPLINYIHTKYKNIFNIIAIYSNSDKKKGRGLNINSTPISDWAKKNNIPLFNPLKLSSNDKLFWTKSKVDLVIVFAYGLIIPEYLINIPTNGCINFHPSILPKYRGPSPIFGSLYNGDKFTGVTLMKINEKIDHGPILDKIYINIISTDDLISLTNKLSLLSINLFINNIDYLLGSKKYIVSLQDTKKEMISYTRKINKKDGYIDFNLSYINIIGKIKACIDWPGSFFYYNNKIIKIKSCSIEINNKIINEDKLKLKGGQFIGLYKNNNFTIQLKEGHKLLIKELQLPGKKWLPAKNFLNGFKIEKGIIFNSIKESPIISKIPFEKK